jgi:tetratricopeptide (TPR) repeat protein
MNSRKRYIISLIFISLFIQAATSQNANKDKFYQGVTYYSAGTYKEALQTWTDIYNTGYRSANLDYNIGNAYFKLNNVPLAILFYERAYLLKPADEDINYNLQVARTLIVDRFQEIPELFFVRWYNFVSLYFSTNTWAKISLSTFILFLLFLSLYIYTSQYKFKVSGFWLAIIFIVISSATLTFSLRNRSLVYNSHKAIIFNSTVSGKSSPDKSGNDLFVLHEGTKVTVEDAVGDWLEIRLSDGNKGWVPVNSIVTI